MQTPSRLDPKFAAITAGIVAIIIYGSLYPFQFSVPARAANPVISLLATWRSPVARDVNISNFLLYFLFGLFAFRIRRSLPAIAVVTLAGCALSVAIEIAQLYDVG